MAHFILYRGVVFVVSHLYCLEASYLNVLMTVHDMTFLNIYKLIREAKSLDYFLRKLRGQEYEIYYIFIIIIWRRSADS